MPGAIVDHSTASPCGYLLRFGKDGNMAKITRRAEYRGVFTLSVQVFVRAAKTRGRAAGSGGRRGPG